MNENEMENRVSKSIISENIIVKEQRVDGSYIGAYYKIIQSPMLRCTLMGFERSCQPRNPSNLINKLRLYSTATICEDKSKMNIELLNPYFLTGFIDAEGTFMVRVRRNPRLNTAWSVEAKFSICIHKRDIAALKLIKNYFNGIGSLTKASKDTINYRVTSLDDLTKVIIPHFEKYPLITQKKGDFMLFKRVVDLMNSK